MKKVYLYKGYERFWHWTQTVLVFILLITGFEIHGSYSLLGYEQAVNIHNTSAWVFLVLTVFTIFWHVTTSAWRQYIPTRKNFKEQIDYYISGIFKRMPHPTGKTLLSKLNPIQRVVYLALKILVFPVMFATGFLYLFFHFPVQGIELQSLESIAVIHTLGAYVLVAFVVVHLYLITTGRTTFSNLKAMVTGWEEIPDAEVKAVIQDVIDETGQLIRHSNGKKGEKERKEVNTVVSEAFNEKIN
ncbi:MAG: cytochrome b/b6 domain-containing protein [Bacteroidetes bacterium]|nr:cytochrome b/b6 domain-containing protein [Bacteroidota bacterium]